MLDPLHLTALAAACAPTVAPQTLLAVARVESGLEPLAIGVNGPGRAALRPRTLREAVATARALSAAGRNLDLGLLQINVRNLGPLGLGVAEAFDPCRSLAAGAALLRSGYAKADAGRSGPQAALRTALSFYNTGDPTRGFHNGYVARVVAAAAAPVPTAARTAGEPTPSDVFGRPYPNVFVFTPAAGAQP